MADREWPVNRARAWLLRRAADEVASGSEVVAKFIVDVALAEGGSEVSSEAIFRWLLDGNTVPDAIDRAVADVYGEPAALGTAAQTRVAELEAALASLQPEDLGVWPCTKYEPGAICTR